LPLLALALASSAQFATLTDASGASANGQLIVHWGDQNTPHQSVPVLVEVNGSSARTVSVRRYELSVLPGTQNYFCWGVCYGPQDAGALPIWTALPQHVVDCEPGVPVNNFQAYYSPQGALGSSVFRYVWFDVAAPTDTVWCDIDFRTINNVGVEELGPSATLGVFPNPSRGQDVQFALELTNVDQGVDLAVFNALGARVRTITVRPGQVTARLGTAELSEGLYFASVLQGGRVLATQRFVIGGR
jgi:hypothetical protein